MRLIKLVFLAVLMLAIVVLSVANRGAVTLNLLPEGLDQIYSYSLEVPLFVIILVSILTGLLLGYILEWLREYKYRREAAEKKREASVLASEVDKLRKQTLTEEEEVLALIDSAAKNA